MRFLLACILYTLTFIIGYVSRETENMFLKDIYTVLLPISGISFFLVTLPLKRRATSENEETDTDTSQDGN